jgi:hypothetical protein
LTQHRQRPATDLDSSFRWNDGLQVSGVVPAKAGTQVQHLCRNIDSGPQPTWIPAFAGMTVFRSAASFQRRLEPKFITFAATSTAARNRPGFQPSLE